MSLKDALLKAGLVNEDQVQQATTQAAAQRAARTKKGRQKGAADASDYAHLRNVLASIIPDSDERNELLTATLGKANAEGRKQAIELLTKSIKRYRPSVTASEDDRKLMLKYIGAFKTRGPLIEFLRQMRRS